MEPIDLVKPADVTIIERIRSIAFEMSIDRGKSSESALLDPENISETD
jgi:hypothetical protein